MMTVEETTKRLLILLAIVTLSSCGNRTRESASSGASPGAGAGVAFAAQQVDVDFVAAWSRFQKGDRSGAGRYLDRAANTLRSQGGDTRTIAGLSQQIKRGGSVNEQQFDRIFSGSHRAMAIVRQNQANRQLALRDGRAAGASMEAIAYHTERSAHWSGQALTASQQSEVSNLRKTGVALRAGSGYLVKGSGYVVQGTGWVLGKGFNLVTRGGQRTRGRAGSVIRGTGQGGEIGSGWIKGAGDGIQRFGDWMVRP